MACTASCSGDETGLTGLYSRYVFAIDAQDLDQLAACFAEDAVYEVIDGYRLSGRPEILSGIPKRWDAANRHRTHDLLVERITPQSSARARAKFVVTRDARWLSAGEYADDLVWNPGAGWRFARRSVLYQWRRGETTLETHRNDQMLGLSVDEVLTTTRAVRKRLDLERPVPLSVIRECLEIALQAPSGGNAQPWNFVVVTDQAARTAIADVYRRAFAIYEVDQAARGVGADDGVLSSARYLAQNLHRVPCFLIPIMRGRAESLATTHAQAISWGSVIPATWSFMLAARERGLGTSWTTMHLRYEQEVAEILGIPFEHYTQAALIPVAATKGIDFRPARRNDLTRILHVDRW